MPDNDGNPELVRVYGAVFLVMSSTALFFEICVMIAVYRLAKKSEPFIIIFSQGLAEALSTAQIVWLSVEIIVQHSTGLSHKGESLILRGSWYPECLHQILVALNRSHSITFPLSRHTWSRRKLIGCVVVCWLLGIALDFGLVLGIPSDDDANFGHDFESVEFGRIDRTKFGADAILRANLFVYLSTIGTCSFVYGIALATIARSMLRRRKDVSPIWRPRGSAVQMRLFIICFANFVPFSLLIFLNFVSPPRSLTGNFFKTFINILNSFVNSTLLFCFSSWVRRQMPWPFKGVLERFEFFRSAGTPVSQLEKNKTTVF